MADTAALADALSSADAATATAALDRLRTVAGATPAGFVALMRTVPLPVLFTSLSAASAQQRALAQECLEHLLRSDYGLELLRDEASHPVVAQGLDHPDPLVRALVLTHAVREPSCLRPVLPRVVQCLRDESTKVAEAASAALLVLAQRAEERAAAVAGVKAVLEEPSAVVRFRAYAFFLALGARAFAECHATGAFTRLLGEATAPDPLVQLNAIEMVQSLVKLPEGLALVLDSGLVAQAEAILLGDDSLAKSLLSAPLVAFLCELFHAMPEHTNKEVSRLPEILTEMIEAGSGDEQMAALLGLGLAGADLALERRPQLVAALGRAMASPNDTLRPAALEAFAAILSAAAPGSEAPLVLFKAVPVRGSAGSAVQSLVALCRQPFRGVRMAALGAVLALARQQPWGPNAILSEPEAEEYLLDRGSEAGKDGGKAALEIKFEILAALAAACRRGGVQAPPELCERCQTYVDEGAFFAPVSNRAPEVAVQERY